MGPVLVCFSGTVANTDETNLGEERVYVTYRLQSIFLGSQGRNLEAGADTVAMEGCFSWLAL